MTGRPRLTDQAIITKAALFFLPTVYFLAGIIYRQYAPPFYYNSLDPEYAYLFNGLNVAQFTTEVWHVDHPGTPLQFLCAFVIRIVYLFSGKEPGVVDDVIRNPERYLYCISASLLLINAAATYCLGRVALRLIKSLRAAIFLQLTPFVPATLFGLVTRVNTESILLFSVLLMLIQIIKYTYAENSGRTRQILMFGIISGLAVSTKITALPICLIPLVLIRDIMKKIIYCSASFASFILFILPVLLNRRSYFLGWIKALFFHSGRYGKGDSQIVNADVFFNNIKEIFTTDPLYSIPLLFLALALIVFPMSFVRIGEKNWNVYRALAGIFIATLLNIAMVAKHYAYYYLVPSLAFGVVTLYLLFVLFGLKMRQKSSWILYTALVGGMLWAPINTLFRQCENALEQKREHENTRQVVQQIVGQKPMIAITDYYGSSLQSGGIFFGISWVGDFFGQEYRNTAAKYYGPIYLYYDWDQKFHDWQGDGFSFDELAAKNRQLFLYTNVQDGLNTIPEGVNWNVRFDKVFANDTTNETIYKIERTEKTSLRFCDAEKVTVGKTSFEGADNIPFGNGETQTNEKARSGIHSAKLSPGREYAFTFTMGRYKKGDTLLVSVWRHVSNREGIIVLSTKDAKKLYVAQGASSLREGEWEQLSIKYVVTEATQNEELKVYVWAASQKPAFFDDMRLEKR